MNNVYVFNNSWNYVKKVVNQNNFTISYEQAGGFSSKKKAEAAYERDEKKYEADIAKIKRMTNMRYTFQEFVEYWLTDIFLPNTDTVTKVYGVWAVKRLILPHTNQDIIIGYITPEYINDIIKRCIPDCESAGECASKYMRRILKDAYRLGYLKKDITDDLMKVKRSIPQVKILDKAQFSKLLKVASKDPGYYLEILLASFVGLRSGEIRGLRYEDFDRENKTLRVRRQYTSNYFLSCSNDQYQYERYTEEKSPKADSYRLIFIPDFIFDELEYKKEFNQKILDNRKHLGHTELDQDSVSISPFGTIKKPGTLTNALKRMCITANIPTITFHALRHQFATMLIEKGVPLEQISKLMGHRSTMTTFNIYCGVMDAGTETKEVLKNLMPVHSEEGWD